MSDLPTRLAALSPEKRALLQKMLRQETRFSGLKEQAAANNTETNRYDVVILGGGLAGLTLALQIKKTRPTTTILVIEKKALPLPETEHKIGESTLEIGSHYFDTIIGMKQHLDAEQLPKLGLRFFTKAHDNSDIAQRIELGSFRFLWHPSYQLNRARFENALASECVRLGVAIQDQCVVRDISFATEQHLVKVELEKKYTSVAARWVVDASGRAAILRRQLGLTQQVGHDANAVWLHIDDEIDIGSWSDNSAWLDRIKKGLRRLSTNHLLGDGYWVWLIPVVTGSTSIGIVADNSLHPLPTLNKLDRALAWLHKYEPQVAAAIENSPGTIEDFRVQRHFAHGCKQAYSPDRWCLTGEAAVFTDPLYSLGSDFIGMGNTFITDLITRELEGESIQERSEFFNWFFLETWFRIGIALYENNYSLMKNTQVALAKILWDSGIYWAYFGTLFFHRKLSDLAFMTSIREQIQRVMDLTIRLQAFFREWDDIEKKEWHGRAIDWSEIKFLYNLHWGMGVGLDDNGLKEHLTQNVRIMETVATEMFFYATRSFPNIPRNQQINPYAISLDPEQWSKEGLFLNQEREPLPSDLAADLQRMWLELDTNEPIMAVELNLAGKRE
jgi:flavin-dependent dehydrogenase